MGAWGWLTFSPNQRIQLAIRCRIHKASHPQCSFNKMRKCDLETRRGKMKLKVGGWVDADRSNGAVITLVGKYFIKISLKHIHRPNNLQLKH